MKDFNIKSTDGSVLHSGRARSVRGLIEQLLRTKTSLAGADLSRLDLANINFSHADLRGACFDGTDLRGCDASGADFSDASFLPAEIRKSKVESRLRSADLTGSCIESAIFDGADLSEARLPGVKASYASFRGAKLDRANFANSTSVSCLFIHSSCLQTSFEGASLRNADFAHASLINANFRTADLGHGTFSTLEAEKSKRLTAHLPNRTRGALVVGCDYKDATLASTVPGLVTDRWISRSVRIALYTGTTVAVLMAGHHLLDLCGGVAASLMGSKSTGTLTALGALMMVKEFGGEWIRDKSEEFMGDLARKVRSAMDELDRSGAQRASLVVTMAKGRTLEPLRLALAARQPHAKKRGIYALFKSFHNDLGQVIVCDRRHLALALAMLTVHANRGFDMPHDIVLLRCNGTHDEAEIGPCAISFLADGETSAVWPVGEHGHATVRYSRKGEPKSCWNDDGVELPLDLEGLPKAALCRLDAALAFEAGLLRDHDLHRFSYPQDTHMIRDGRDGSILVHRKNDNKIDNPEDDQPAIITSDGHGIRIRNGVVKQEWSGPHP